MTRIKILTITLLLLFVGNTAGAQTADSVDMLDYDIALDLSHGAPFTGDATLTLRLTAPCQTLALDLYGTADSVWVEGVRIEYPLISALPTASFQAGDTLTVRVCYHSNGYVESYGWGGFHFDNNLSYNLGVGFNANPHVMGAAMMPCRDNFHDKATYTLRMLTKAGWTAQCGGMLQERIANADGTESSVWRIEQPTPTYLVSVSQAAWNRQERTVSSLYGTYPLSLGYLISDSAGVSRAFDELDSVVPMFERCFGPYRWNRIGYIATPKGSMESVNNIALDQTFINSRGERAQMTIAHELGHAWFGNLVTCATEADMWINEGGASFTSEVAMESVKGREASNKYYQTNLENVLRYAHVADNGYRALSPMPHQYTYGTTTYDKGALVWHSLRGYLGDSVFYSALNRLMEAKAFGNVSAEELRDSLSLYTGVDLTDFFDYHVFTPGFVDYNVSIDQSNCMNNVIGVRVRQQSIANDRTVVANRVPVTFFANVPGQGKRQEKTVLTFDDVENGETYHTVALPFVPDYCVLDYDKEFSDAATLGVFRLDRTGTFTYAEAHMRVQIDNPFADGEELVVEHHWGQPWDIEPDAGVVRTTGRYWVVRGSQEIYPGMQGRFRFVRDGYTSGNYTALDRGFVRNTASLDSVAVLFRERPDRPWRSVSHQRTSNTNECWFIVDNLCTGEYTLAVIDTALMAIAGPEGIDSPTLFPNPIAQGTPLTLQVPFDENFTVHIFDASGRQVWSKRGCRNGRKVSPRLASGTYLVRIENNFVSLQSKLIVL